MLTRLRRSARLPIVIRDHIQRKSQSGALLVEMAVVFVPFLLLSIIVTLEMGRALSHIVHFNQMGYHAGLLASQVQDGNVIDVQNRLNQLAPIYKLQDWSAITLSNNVNDSNHVVWDLSPTERKIFLQFAVPLRIFYFPLQLHFSIVMPHVLFVESSSVDFNAFGNPSVMYDCAGRRGQFIVDKDCCQIDTYCS